MLSFSFSDHAFSSHLVLLKLQNGEYRQILKQNLSQFIKHIFLKVLPEWFFVEI